MEIRIENLNKYFKQNHILSIDNMVFDSGDIVGLTGKNGSGKSTLLNIIAGIDLKYQGKILYDGLEYKDIEQKDITLVHQKPYIFKKTVFENIEYPLKLRKISKLDRVEKVNFYLDKLNLKSISDRSGNVLSGGETQKVSLARALILEPKLLLLDEFTSNIDDKMVSEMENLVLEYHREKKASIIVVSHNKEQINRLCNKEINLTDINRI
ncbi:MAG: ATP-binding cassette domain-containing protein [Andreesenia angusta]|nr:ATP-binding cassette domain-containing protein [Andreesenia angusta]